MSLYRKAVSNILWGNSNNEYFLRLIKSKGFEGIEFAPSVVWPKPIEATKSERSHYRKSIERFGLKIISLHTLFYTRRDLNLFGSPQVYRQTEDYLVELASLASDLGASLMIYGSPKSRMRGDLTKEAAYEWASTFFKKVAARLKPLGVTLCIEPLSSKEADFINNHQEAVYLVKKVNHPNFQMMLDTKSLYLEGEDYQMAFSHSQPYLKHIHVNDPGNVAPGTKGVDHQQISTALSRIKYSGFLSLEVGRNENTPEENFRVGHKVLECIYNSGGLPVSRRIKDIIRIQERHQDRRKYLRLDKNERTYNFSDDFVRKLKDKLDSVVISAYPETRPLYDKLADVLKVKTEELYLSAGSEYGIKAVFEALVDPGDKILLHLPGYAMYGIYARLGQVETVYQNYEPDLRFDLDKYIARITPNFKIAVLENPNGFIGNAYGEYSIRRFIESCQQNNVIALLDEAYFYFYNVTAINWVRDFNNLIVARTFSKAMGAAGTRIGYLVCNKRLMHQIQKVKPMHEINHFALVTGLHLLENMQETKSYISEINRSKQFILAELDRRNIPVIDTHTNFILVKWPDDGDIKPKFKDRGILIRRPFGQSFLKGWTRVTAGSAEQMKQLLRVVDELFKGRK